MADAVRKLIADQRAKLDETDRDSAPRVVHALIENTPAIFKLSFQNDEVKPAFDVVMGSGWSAVVRSSFKTEAAASMDQLALWPASQREHVQAVGRARVFVPSRGIFVALRPGAISATEVIEAATFLRSRGRDVIGRSDALKRLGEAMQRSARKR